jgi:hypothetical protein
LLDPQFTMASNNESDDISWWDKGMPGVEGVGENETLFGNSVWGAHKVSDEMLHPSGRDVLTAIHSQAFHLDDNNADADILGQPAWVTMLLTKMESLENTVHTQHAEMQIAVHNQHAEIETKMESLESTMLTQHAEMQTKMESLESTVLTMQTKVESLEIAMAAVDMTALKSTVKAVGENLTIRDGNYQSLLQTVPHDHFMMIILDDGEQVGQVPAAVTKMNHCFGSVESVLGMTNAQINTFVEAYGEQAVNIPAQSIAFELERAKKVLEFLTASFVA